MMWQEYFLTGWANTGNVLAMFLGGATAVVLAVAVMSAALLILGAVLAFAFNRVTDAMAKRWEKTGKQPPHRWAEIIARGRHRNE